MIYKDDLMTLNKFQAGGYFVTSLYLNVDGKRYKKKDYEIKLKALIKERKQEVDRMGLSQEANQSLMDDFARILNYVTMEYDGKSAKSLTIFSCTGLKFWKVYSLPHAVHPRLVISKQPYIRPLVAELSDNKFYFAVLTSREKARLFSYYMNELEEHSQILDDIPGQVRMAGWYGLEERRIERHIDDLVHRHFKNVAEGAFQYIQNHRPDCIIIGGRREIIPEFERHLHSTIQEKIIARIVVDPEATVSEIREVLQKTVEKFESNEQKRLLKKLFEQNAPEGLGVTGLKATLKALWHGQVSTLFVTEDYSRPGYYCPHCWFMSDNEEQCANDHTPMKPSHDIIEDAIETAMFQNCEIIRVKDRSALAGEYEHIGALLRFRI